MREGSIQASGAWRDNAFGVALGTGVRVGLSGGVTLRAELRYSGFTFKPGTVHWASVITPALTTSVAF
jgi:opacity protein-like surface antigen